MDKFKEVGIAIQQPVRETSYANDERAINEFVDGIKLQPKAEFKHLPIPAPHKVKMLTKHR